LKRSVTEGIEYLLSASAVMGFASYLSLVQVLALFPLGVALRVAVFDAEGWSVLRA